MVTLFTDVEAAAGGTLSGAPARLAASRDFDAISRHVDPNETLPAAAMLRQGSGLYGRVAVAHDYFTQLGGAERVALSLARLLGQRNITTSFYDSGRTFPDAVNFQFATSQLNHVSAFRRDPRLAMPLLASAWRRARVDDTTARMVIASSSGWSHRLRTSLPLVVYCHNTPRWLYQPDEYFCSFPSRVARSLRWSLSSLQSSDRAAALGATVYIANSKNVAERIHRHYGIDATVLNPPVSHNRFGPRLPVAGVPTKFVLTVARPRGYKNVEVVAAGARAAGLPLVVVGGPMKSPSEGVIHLGRVSEEQLRWLYSQCATLAAASSEDFGLTPVEAHLYGKPVAAWRHGGYLETVLEGINGSFFDRLTASSVAHSLRACVETEWNPELIQLSANRFSPAAFTAELIRILSEVIGEMTAA
jgi:glycosyltransferase involved in cell wall biosynthesis